MIGLKDQSEVQQKPIVTSLRAFSHTLVQLPAITSSFDWFIVLENHSIRNKENPRSRLFHALTIRHNI